VVPVEWGSRDAAHYEVNIVVHGYDRKGLLKDVSGAISNADIDVLAASTRTDPDEGTAEMHFALRVRDFGQLSGLLSRILALPNVLDARRVTASAGR
jgi:GTP pyrophosphokinase